MKTNMISSDEGIQLRGGKNLTFVPPMVACKQSRSSKSTSSSSEANVEANVQEEESQGVQLRGGKGLNSRPQSSVSPKRRKKLFSLESVAEEPVDQQVPGDVPVYEEPVYEQVPEDEPVKKRKLKSDRKKEMMMMSSVQEAGPSSGVVPVVAAVRKVVTKCRPAGLFKLFKSFSDKQKQDVKDIGFGGLLHLSVTETPRDVLPWLVGSFDGQSRIFSVSDGKFVITPDDVCDVFGLPNNRGRKIVFGSASDESDNLLRVGWKRRFGIEPKDRWVPVHLLEEAMLLLREGGVEFKRFFIMFAMVTFLAPTGNRSIDFKLLRVLEDTEDIKNLDWCTYVLEKLCEAVAAWRKNVSQQNVSGCLTFLLVVYFHRMVFRGEPAPSELPLIKHWNDQAVKQRLKLELAAGGWGRCGILDSVTYPVCRQIKKGQAEVPSPSPVIVNVNAAAALPEAASDSSRIIRYELPVGALSDDDIHHMANDAIEESLLLFKRNMNVILDIHMAHLSSVKDAPCSSSSDAIQYSNMSTFIVESVEKMMMMKKSADELVSSYRLAGISPEQREQVEELVNWGNDQLEQDKLKNAAAPAKVYLDPHRRLKDHIELIFPSFPSDLFFDSPLFRSSFMKKFGSEMEGLPHAARQVVDYCFSNTSSMDISETLVSFDGFGGIQRSEIMSLDVSKQIKPNVVECWSILLNSAGSTSYFFGLRHSDSLLKIGDHGLQSDYVEECVQELSKWTASDPTGYDISRAKQMFVPLHIGDHFSVVSVDFSRHNIDYLDDRKLEDNDWPYYLNFCQNLRHCLAMFLKNIKHPEAGVVDSFEIKYPMLDWRSNRKNFDSGVFTMMHMKAFDGLGFDIGLDQAKKRRFYRAEICAHLVLTSLNSCRVDVFRNMKKFYSESSNSKSPKKGFKSKKSGQK